MRQQLRPIQHPLALSLLLLLLAPLPAGAQAIRGSLLGTITDSSGAGVPGATVNIVETRTNIATSTVTNERGFYNFPNLKDGIYRVEAELTGFRKTVRDNVQVDVNTTVRVDLALQTGEMTETLTVTAETPALQTDRADTGRLIQGEQIAAMPLGFNRNFQGMWTTVPGTVRPFKPHSEFFNSQDSLSTQVNGQSRLANNVQIEGIDNNHKTGLLTVLIPPADALETVSVTTSNYDAEFGRAGGAVTSVTLKSGTNDLRGSGFYFGNTDATIAKPYFANTKPETAYHQAGFTLGGPILRNKFFFFGDYQRTNDDLGRVYRFAVPTAAMRNGDFSGAPTTVYDPLTGDANGNGRTPFQNNTIPRERLSPIALAILDKIPLPNLNVALPGQNYETTATREKRVDSFDVKFNYQASIRDQLSYRYSFQRPKLVEPAPWGVYGGPFGDGFLGTGTNTTYSTAVNWTRTWSNTLVMDARGGVSKYHNEAIPTGFGQNTADELGIRGVNLDEFTSGMPRIEVQNGWGNPFAGFSPSLPWDRSERTINVAVTFTKLLGNHTVKVGHDFRHNRDILLQVQDQGGPRGRWRFGAAQTGSPADAASQGGFANSLAAFLLDRPGEVGRDLAVLQRPGTRHSAYFSFIHDKWQVTPKMTVDLGLRHEYYTPLVGVESRGGLSNYEPATNTLRVSGYGDIPDNLGVKGTWRNFDARTGLSYRLDERTVIRGGYGSGTIPFPDNIYAFNLPVKQRNQFNSANSFVPVTQGTMGQGIPAPVIVDVPSSGILDAASLRTQGFDVVPLNLKEGRLHSWNVAYQRQLPGNFTAEAAYVGNHGQNILARFNLNATLVPGLDQAGRPLNQQFGRTADTTTWIPTSTNYHSLQTKLDRRFKNGFLITNSYTLGRGMNYSNGDSNGDISTPADMALSYGLLENDRRHVFTSSAVYDVPFSREGLLGALAGGWQFAGLFTAQSGRPFDILASGANLRAPGNTQRPDQSGKAEVFGDVSIAPGTKWFDTSVFSLPAPNTFGNVSRNGAGIRGPAYVNFDASLVKRFTITGDVRAEFRLDVFNVFNKTHFEIPAMAQRTLDDARFGEITSTIANTERMARFGLRVLF